MVIRPARQKFDLVLRDRRRVALRWLGIRLRTSARLRARRPGAAQRLASEVFALGDCATLRDSPHPKSGVYAVRHGEALIENLRRLIAGGPLEPYAPRKKALLLLSCGARYAIAERGGWSAQGRWVWWWKNRIDRRWIRSFL
jgi:NADH dehydrogenase FAD-containing subunit